MRAICFDARGKCVTAHSDRTTQDLNIPSEAHLLEDLLSPIRHRISFRKEQEGEEGSAVDIAYIYLPTCDKTTPAGTDV